MFEIKYSGLRNCDSRCSIDVVELNNSPDRIVVILTELPNNTGTSITMMIENIATKVYHKYLTKYDPDKIIWIEHYPPEYFKRVDPILKTQENEKYGTYKIVRMKYIKDNRAYADPEWVSISLDELKEYGIKL